MSRFLLFAAVAVVASSTGCMHHDAGPDLVVGYENRGTTVALAAGQTLAVELRSGGSAGYDPWVVGTAPDPAVLALVRSEHEAPAQMPGATGTDRFVFDAVGAGSTSLVAIATSSPYREIMTFELRVVVRGALR